MNTKGAGFTLLELMFALAMLAVLVAMATPSYREYTRESRATGAQNDLITALNVARSEALRRGVPVSVCASTNASACSGASDWSKGWFVFTDASGSVGDFDADDTVLQQWSGYSADLVVTGTGTLPYVRYLPGGMLDAASAPSLTLYVTGCKGPKKRTISIALPGFVSNAKTSC
jgi:type IV fimbrial biogenesis protein FimT